jgi:hypothetical protein
VVYAAVVRRDIVGVEEHALLYCSLSVYRIYRQRLGAVCTSLEARYWCRDLDAAREKVGKGGKDCGQGQSHCRSSSEYEELVLRVGAHSMGWLSSRHRSHDGQLLKSGNMCTRTVAGRGPLLR